MSLHFQFEFGQLLVVESALETMDRYRQTNWRRREAGGVLLGRHLLDASDIVVDEVTAPQRRDKRSRYSFFRSQDHQEVVMTRWAASHGTQTYLGLWHTHPESGPTPSTTDLRDWRRACRKDQYFGGRLFFLIVGTSTICVWQGDRNGNINQLEEYYRHGKKNGP